jgi:hypothetical protein
MKIIYTAGPYRAASEEDKARNVERAKWWAEALWRLGLTVICPHVNTYDMDMAIPPEEFVRRDLYLVGRCDAVFMLPGWEQSEGAGLERKFAMEHGIPIFYWTDTAAIVRFRDEPRC